MCPSEGYYTKNEFFGKILVLLEEFNTMVHYLNSASHGDHLLRLYIFKINRVWW